MLSPIMVKTPKNIHGFLEIKSKISSLLFCNSLLSDNLDPDYIDILIREKFMFGKKGESTYIVNNDS